MATKKSSSSQGWVGLRNLVDPLALNHLQTTMPKLPGLSVAVARRGRLLLAGGYGFADIENNQAMTRDHTILIGSVTKASVTGPTLHKLLNLPDVALDPKTTKLYGPDGVLGNSYMADAELGTRRHTPIVAIAIGPEDRVYSWRTDMTMCVGSSQDLDRYAKPVPYTLPAGKKPVDIRSIAFDSDGVVYTWFDDKTCVRGEPTKLGAGKPGRIQDLASGPVDTSKAVVLPSGRSMLHVVGIGIAKSDNRVYVWYEDGGLSCGTPWNLGEHFVDQTFDPGPAGSAHEIRDIEIAHDDHVYAWFADGKVSSGTSKKLDHYRPPYDYSWPACPNGPDWKAWYASITLQQLLDHTSGFDGSGDVPAAEAMFESQGPLTYANAHRHFLRTHKLRSAPGSVYKYSNHGFGTLTLVVEALSGISFRDYVEATHLGPLGLGDKVIPHPGSGKPMNARDYNHDKAGGLKPVDVPASTLGLAAGGYRASAESLLKITKHLDQQYSDVDIDRMGWMKGSGGRLHHSGAIGGGCCHVVMFPTGSKIDSIDVGGVHVALVANARDDHGPDDTDDELGHLAVRIAKAVAAAKVPPAYNLWLLNKKA